MRIKENEIKEILKTLNHKNLIVKTKGIIIQEFLFKNSEIIFLDNGIEFNIKSDKNYIIFNLSYIQEINLLEKNKLKFLTDQELEILIFVI